MVYGYSVDPPAPGETTQTVDDTVESHATALKAVLDRLSWLRRRLASLTDQTAEPDDIEVDDIARNTEREA